MSKRTGVLFAALIVGAVMAWPAQAVVLPQGISQQLQQQFAAFVQADGYSEVDLSDFPNDDWYTPARFPALGSGYSSVFRPDHNLGPVTRVVLLLQSREKALPHVRYRITYRLSAAPGDYADVQHAYVEVTRFNLGPALRREQLALAAGNYPVAPKKVFGIGPHVSWRFVTATNQGMRAAIVRASRNEISVADAEVADCLGVPCLSLVDPGGPKCGWRQPTPPALAAPVYGDPDNHMPGPARIAQYLFAYATRNGFEPAFGNFADQPQMIFVLSKNIEGQEATRNGLLHQPHVMDHTIADIWTKRLQAGPEAVDWQVLVVRRSPVT